VTGASDSSLLFVPHSTDSPEDLGDVCSGCDCDCDGRRESWGMERGSEGIGSSGCDVDVSGRRLCLGMVCVEDAMERDGWWWRRRRREGLIEGATKADGANHG
jgi:hypothetical protein